MARAAFEGPWGTPSGDGVPHVRLMARLSYALLIVSLVLGVLWVLLILSLNEGGVSATGLFVGAVLILNAVIRLWARRR
jgi:hypothetical protein